MEKLYILNRDFWEGKGVNLENRKKVFGCIFGMLEVITRDWGGGGGGILGKKKKGVGGGRKSNCFGILKGGGAV